MLWRRYHAKAQASGKAEKGKKRMRQFGQVEIPQSAFLEALRMEDR